MGINSTLRCIDVNPEDYTQVTLDLPRERQMRTELGMQVFQQRIVIQIHWLRFWSQLHPGNPFVFSGVAWVGTDGRIL